MKSSVIVFGLLAAALFGPGCSDSGGAEGTGGDSSSSAGYVASIGGGDLTAGSGDGASSGSVGPAVEVATGSGSCGSLRVSNGCTGEVFEGEGIPLDIQIIFDQSGSMATVVDAATGETRLQAVSRALEAFMGDARSIGLGVGVSFFGYQPIGATSCNADDYDAPAVAISSLPDNADKLLAAVGAVAPTGETPTGAAIEGGCRIALAHRAQNPGRQVVNLLVTDGEPKAPVTSKSRDCSPTLDGAVAAAQECLAAGEGILSYVLGVGPSLDNLDRIAAAGGTDKAYLVADDTASGVLEALNQVRATAQIPCELPVDTDDESLRYDETSVVTLDQDCRLSHLENVMSAAGCAAGGFYFDEPESPSTILLCESTCRAAKRPGMKLLYSIACGIEEVK